MSSIFDSQEFNRNLFFPRPDNSQTPAGKDEIFIKVESDIRVHVRRHPNPAAKFSLLYFHGNGEIVSDYDDLERYISILEAELIICDYRGYGKSEGAPTLRKVLHDARFIYCYLKENGKLLTKVCVMGRSLGSASAIEICSRYKEIDCCVIESGYADPVPLVERRGLKINSTTHEEDMLFNNSKKIQNISCPLLIMHGNNDTLINPNEAELNHQNAGSKTKILQLLDGVGHNDILLSHDYFPSLKRFFNETTSITGR